MDHVVGLSAASDLETPAAER